jgi:lytic cellulose monooxygenase (C1-hydroxylating)
MECAQIKVTGSGTNKGSNFVSFPGAYKANDPGILLSIYDSKGSPYLGGNQYQIPGPAPLQCSASDSSGDTGGTDTPAPDPSSGGGATAALYAQCGGIGWTGATVCAEGVCKASGDYYSQCVPA